MTHRTLRELAAHGVESVRIEMDLPWTGAPHFQVHYSWHGTDEFGNLISGYSKYGPYEDLESVLAAILVELEEE